MIIKFLKNFFKPERQDPHLVMYEDVLKSNKPILKKCLEHPTKFKHRCPKCQETVA